MANLPADTAVRLAGLLAALTAITVEDLAAIRSAGTLGPDIPANIEALQALAGTVDAETIADLNAARGKAGL